MSQGKPRIRNPESPHPHHESQGATLRFAHRERTLNGITIRRSLGPLVLALAATLMTLGFTAPDGRADWPGAKFIEFGGLRKTEAHQTAVQADGKIVVVGYGTKSDLRRGNLVVTRLLPDGTLDPTFGENGRAVIWSEDLWAFFDVEIQQDGGILVLGTSSEGLGVIRVNPDGTADPGFGHKGIAAIRFMTDWGIPWGSISLGPDDTITYAGTSYRRAPKPQYWKKETVILKLTADGKRDRSFAGTGLMKRAKAWSRVTLSGQTMEDGSVLAVGATRLGKQPVSGFARFGPSLAKVGPSGKPDQDFGKNGIRKLSGLYSAAPRGYRMRTCSPVNSMFDRGGRIVVLANCVAKKDGGQEFPMMGALLRFLPDGTPDLTFAGDGSRALVARPATMFGSIAEGPDGSLTLAGMDINTDSSLIFRVGPSGETSPDLGPNGYRYYSGPREKFSPGISVDDRGWTYAPITTYKDAKKETDEQSWFGVVAIPKTGRP